MAYIPSSSSVVAFQSDPTKLVGTVSVVGINFGNTSVIAVPQGSVTALQGTNPWQVNVPSPSTISYQLAGSVLAVAGVTSGNSSVTAFQGGLWTTSLVSTVPSSVVVGASIQGTVPVTQTTTPWVVNMPSPSVIAIQSGGSIMAVNMPSPSIIAYQLAGSVLTISNNNSSVVVNNIVTGQSSVYLIPGVGVLGSVATLQGTNPWIVGNSSVLAFQGTLPWVIQSVVGTFADNSAWTEGNSGLYTLNVRNDTMSSVSAADVRYSPGTVGPVGERIVANSPITKWVRGITSVFTGTSVQAVAPQGASVFTYITGIQVTNASANNVYLTFTGGLGGISSTLGYTPAPANGGAMVTIPNAWVTGQNSGFSASVSGVASIYLAVQGFISKT